MVRFGFDREIDWLRGHSYFDDAVRIQQHARQHSALGVDIVRQGVVQLFAGKRIASNIGGESRIQTKGHARLSYE
jgi:hypothetical protein